MSFTFNSSPRAWAHVGKNLERSEWCHIACSHDGTTLKCFLDGEETNSTPMGPITSSQTPVLIGSDGWQCDWIGGIDDVRMYDHALSGQEILGTMSGSMPPYAWGPEPKDGALHPDTWVTLRWRPGPYAVSHDVYMGDDFDLVDGATRDSAEFRGNQGGTFLVAGFPGFPYPDGLVPGTTYYWRIDEVNDADPNSPWKGPIWSFSIPPKTAYFPDPPDGAAFVGPDNVTLTWTAGFGAKLHTIYFGEDYDEVNNATVGTPSGTPRYSPGALQREKVYYWRVDEFDGLATYKGDIWCFTTPGAVGDPQPGYGATDIGMNAILSWTPADSAASHQLYVGTDKEAVHTAGPGSRPDRAVSFFVATLALFSVRSTTTCSSNSTSVSAASCAGAAPVIDRGDASLVDKPEAPSSTACSAARRPQLGQANMVLPNRVLHALHTSMPNGSAERLPRCNGQPQVCGVIPSAM